MIREVYCFIRYFTKYLMKYSWAFYQSCTISTLSISESFISDMTRRKPGGVTVIIVINILCLTLNTKFLTPVTQALWQNLGKNCFSWTKYMGEERLGFKTFLSLEILKNTFSKSFRVRTQHPTQKKASGSLILKQQATLSCLY